MFSTDAEMIDLVDAAGLLALMTSESPVHGASRSICGVFRLAHPSHPPYDAIGGYSREEAILILRRFYVTENSNGTEKPLRPAFDLFSHLSSTSAQIKSK